MMRKYYETISKICHLLTTKQIFMFFIILFLALLAAFLETVGVSVIIPLANVLIQPSKLMENKYIGFVAGKVNAQTQSEYIMLVVVGVVLVYIIKNVYLIFYSWAKNKYAFKIQRELSIEMIKSYTNRGYKYFTLHNYSELNQGINGDIFNIYYVILGLTNAITQLAIICCICAFLCYSDWQLALMIIITVLICLFFIICIFRKKMQNAGKKVRYYSILTNQRFKEMVLGIKEVIAMRKQLYYVNLYERLTIRRQKYELTQNVASEIPPYLIEAICITGIMTVIGIRIGSISDREMFVSSLAAFAVGAFKILPSVGAISSSLNLVASTSASLDAVYENIDEARKINGNNSIYLNNKSIIDIHFEDKIEIRNIVFSHDPSKGKILKGVAFEIEKGDSVAIIGESGAGKTTVADLILGLYHPDEGEIIIDGKSVYDIPDAWAKMVGFVPQNIYLADSTIIENVAFGEEREDIDEAYAIECMKKAKIYNFISDLPEGVETKVGESGMRLSGGQRQRIGIARALYHKPEILILDEATSALDNETECNVMESVESLQGTMTLIIIAHRLSTVKKCNKIYEIKDGYAIERRYEDLV